MAAQERIDDLRECFRALLEDHRFTEMWQVRDYVRAILVDGEDDRAAALAQVFCEPALVPKQSKGDQQ